MSNDFKVAGVISSARFNGNTATLVRETQKGAEEEGATVTEIFLPAYNLKHCTGCQRCLTDGECPLPDSFMEIK
jgi:multimeric flavodoxin WrbA